MSGTVSPAAPAGFFALSTATVSQELDVQGALTAAQTALAAAQAAASQALAAAQTATGGSALASPKTLPASPTGLGSGVYWNNGGTISVTP